MTDKPTPTDAELKAMWQLHAADIGGIFCYARAVLAKWGQPAQASKCTCTLAQRCTGSGCRYCNPQEYIDMLHEQIADSETAQAAEPVATIYITQGGAREFDDWMAPLPVGANTLFTAPQPVAREPLSAAQKQHIHNETGAGHALICLVESYLLEAHGIKGGQHGTDT